MKALDTRLRRPVAIKQLLADSRSAEIRFEREALITARLEHPNIVPVHDIGRWEDGRSFYSMKLVSGRTLREAIEETSSLAQRLALLPHVLAVADAIAYAHSEGIIHRDLKPSNVIVGAYGETVVIDWGLAKDLRDASRDDDEREPEVELPNAALTRDGAVMGTPMYMSPEQARGEQVDSRSDVYSLGAILYHLLSGVAPFAGVDGGRILGAVREESPKALTERAPNVPSELAAIVGKAMARDPKARYEAAGGVASDLKKFEAGQYVAAHHYSRLERVRRWAGDHARALVAIAMLVLAGLAIAAAAKSQEVLGEICETLDRKLDGVWDEERRDAVRGAFLSSGKTYAGDISIRVEDALERYSRELTGQYMSSCRATHVAGEQSGEMLDRRTRCLDRRLTELRAQVQVFVDRGGEPATLEKAIDATRNMLDLDVCADVAHLGQLVRLPDDPAVRAEMASIGAQVGAAAAKRRVGLAEEGRELATKAASAAEQLGEPRTEALAQVELSLYPELRGEPWARLGRILKLAGMAGDDQLAAEAWILLLSWIHGDYDRAIDAFPLAEAALMRAGDNRERWQRLQGGKARLLITVGEFDRANELLVALPPDQPEALDLRAMLAHRKGDYASSLVHHRSRAERCAAENGPDNPVCAIHHRRVTADAYRLGNFELTAESAREAIRLRELGGGLDNPELLYPLTSLSYSLSALGRLDEAYEHAERGRKIAALHDTVSVRYRHFPLRALGEVAIARGNYSEARRLQNVILSDLETEKSVLEVNKVRIQLGYIELLDDNAGAALKHFDAVLEGATGAFADLCQAFKAAALIELGRFREARPYLAHAAKRVSVEQDPDNAAFVIYYQGELALRDGDKSTARRLASQAASIWDSPLTAAYRKKADSLLERAQ